MTRTSLRVRDSKVSDSNKISAVAAIVAICALGASIWSGVVARQHNRMSVTPLLVMSFSSAEEDERVGILISNHGVGPGRIVEVAVFVDGESMKRLAYGGLQVAAHKLGINEDWIRFESLVAGDAVLVGQRIPLISSPRVLRSPDRIKRLEAAAARIVIEVQYESLYQELAVTRFDYGH